MERLINDSKLQLVGFNNLTKCLSFNIYDFCAARTERERQAYFDYVGTRFNAQRITEILTGICRIIEANVISVSSQDYDPWGASSLVLMSDLKGGGVNTSVGAQASAAKTPAAAAVMHLDKSHICAHTYPDFVENGTICSFRVDIDIATCGEISPLRALNYMFEAFSSDVVVIDYIVRGFTRDANGRRVYMDHTVRSIQDYIEPKILQDYQCIDLSLQSENIWQTKMLRTNLDERTYFLDPVDLKASEQRDMLAKIKHEMRGVLHMWQE